MFRRSPIRTRVLLVPLVPAVALVAVVAFNLHRSFWVMAGALLAAAIGLVLAVVVARSITRPLRDLAAIAADFDGWRASDGMLDTSNDEMLPPRPLDENTELADLAVAIASGRLRAAEFVTEQRLARRSVTDLVAHLALRNERLLGSALDALAEISRRDHEPRTAAAIARVHRTVARVDRATASALVLIGEGGRVVPTASSISDIVWVASLAIESSDRVDPISLPSASVHADAVADIAHLFAELIENAVAASPPPNRVTVLGQDDGDGGYVLSVVDAGAGFAPDALDVANHRVRRIARLEQVPTREIGLDVVGRLARRHGIAVRLGESAGGGTVVRIAMPAKLFVVPVASAPAVGTVTEPAPAPAADEPSASDTAAEMPTFNLSEAERAGLRTAAQAEELLPKRDGRKWATAIARARN